MAPKGKGTALQTGEGIQDVREPLIRRRMEAFLEDDLRSGRSVVLLGPRRVGKTTLLRRISSRLTGEFPMIFLNGQAVPTLGSLYEALCAALAEEQGAETARRFSQSLEMGRRVLHLVSSYRELQAGWIRESTWVRELYAFLERLPPEQGLLPEGSPLTEFFTLGTSPKDKNGRDKTALIQQLHRQVERLAEEPPERLPECLLAEDSLGEWVLPLLCFEQGMLSGSELIQSLFARLREWGSGKIFVLLDEAQALSREQFQPLLDALLEEESVGFLLCADGLWGPLLRFVQRIGPSRRHPFLPLERDRRVLVRYLGPLSLEEAETLIAEYLRLMERTATKEAIELLQERTGGSPYYLQQLLRLCLWEGRAQTEGSDDLPEPISPQQVERAFEKLLQEEDSRFAEVFERFSPEEQAVLRGIASGASRVDETNPQVRGALDRLAERLYIERVSEGLWQMTDSVFRAWLARLNRDRGWN